MHVPTLLRKRPVDKAEMHVSAAAERGASHGNLLALAQPLKQDPPVRMTAVGDKHTPAPIVPDFEAYVEMHEMTCALKDLVKTYSAVFPLTCPVVCHLSVKWLLLFLFCPVLRLHANAWTAS